MDVPGITIKQTDQVKTAEEEQINEGKIPILNPHASVSFNDTVDIVPISDQDAAKSKLTVKVARTPILRQKLKLSASDISDEKSVDVAFVGEILPPKEVNVHQFYPELEHRFQESTAKFAEDSGPNDVESTSLCDESQSLVVAVETASQDKVPEETTQQPEQKQKEATRKQQATEERQPENVFPTAVDEDTLKTVQSHNIPVARPEPWDENEQSLGSLSMQQIIDEKVAEHVALANLMKRTKDYPQAINRLNKAINLGGENVKMYVDRAENYIQVCDFQSAILNYKRACLMAPQNNELYVKLAFLYFAYGQILYDQRLFTVALESFSRAAEMKPDNLNYHIRSPSSSDSDLYLNVHSISCLAALDRHGECLALINRRLEIDKENPDLYVMRARLHEIFKNTTLCYYDVKDALTLDPEHNEACLLMDKLVQQAENYRQVAMHLIIQGKHLEALQKISAAIETNPSVPDFHVLRGALHRSLMDYNAAIDDFLLALDKCDHKEDHPVSSQSQRQLILTYNDFAVECFRKAYYEEAILLLNKAIKGEKNEKGLYINRGDCFYKQEDLNFALQDYHQALEIDSQDLSIKFRIAAIYYQFGNRAYQDRHYNEAERNLCLAIQYNSFVGQYYIIRARTRYMQENVNGARQDLVLGLLLDPSNAQAMTLMSQLFPGKSIAEVLHSKAANTARASLKSLVSTSPENVPLLTSDTEIQGELTQLNKTQLEKDQGSLFKPCMEDVDFNLVYAYERKMVMSQVKDALHIRRSLTDHGPHLLPLLPISTKPHFGGNVLSKPKKKEKGWRKFGLFIGRAK